MADETRIERWKRTGLLQLIVAGVVLAVWVYFMATTKGADRPAILNDVLLLAVGWLGSTFIFPKDKDRKAKPKRKADAEVEEEGDSDDG